MFDLSFLEILVIIIIATIFLKPQDVAPTLKSLGGMLAKLRRFSREIMDFIEEEIPTNLESDAPKTRIVKGQDGNDHTAYDVVEIAAMRPEKNTSSHD